MRRSLIRQWGSLNSLISWILQISTSNHPTQTLVNFLRCILNQWWVNHQLNHRRCTPHNNLLNLNTNRRNNNSSKGPAKLLTSKHPTTVQICQTWKKSDRMLKTSKSRYSLKCQPIIMCILIFLIPLDFSLIRRSKIEKSNRPKCPNLSPLSKIPARNPNLDLTPNLLRIPKRTTSSVDNLPPETKLKFRHLHFQF